MFYILHTKNGQSSKPLIDGIFFFFELKLFLLKFSILITKIQFVRTFFISIQSFEEISKRERLNLSKSSIYSPNYVNSFANRHFNPKNSNAYNAEQR